VLESLFVLAVQGGNSVEAEHYLRKLVDSYPAEPLYCDRLATLLEGRGRVDEAIALYRALLESRPDFSDSRYNLARLLKRTGHPEDALREYGECLARGIDQAEEVHTNISVIHTEAHRHGDAREALQRALEVNPDYAPALLNMGLLLEEHGEWSEASTLFRKILSRDPRHPRALVHLANGERCTDPHDPLIRDMQHALRHTSVVDQDRENLLYALGKAHDDCGRYGEAFDWYSQANQFSRRRVGPYDRAAQEKVVDQLIAACDKIWMASIEPVSEAPLLFICGMFRSGSTLLEQMLSAHPAIQSGGEIDYFQRALQPFPGALLAADSRSLEQIGEQYIEYLRASFPGSGLVANKRLDNFLHLGLLRALFPGVRILNTLRQPLDNCLSVYFQPLEGQLPYANDLADIAHFYGQYLRLMSCWDEQFGDAICNLGYEELVSSPRDTLERVLTFLGLPWDDACLQYRERDNRVRTASVHQVRRPLYSSSDGRWRNYADQLGPLRDYLSTLGIALPD